MHAEVAVYKAYGYLIIQAVNYLYVICVTYDHYTTGTVYQ